ncbi:MAG TPA: histone deacetylase [Gemmatimonadota bacterium]|nr:histone deacetylase [Gemmatimonadota bacterium]
MSPRPPVVWSPAYEVDIGEHVYPTRKYGLVRRRLLEADVIREGEVADPEPASREDLARVHTGAWLEKIDAGELSLQEQRRLEVPFSPELRTAAVTCCGGSILTGRRALEDGLAVHLGGGFHHAFADHGEGFCLLNDVAVALRSLLGDGLVERAAVVDCDLHHGNGTAAIFANDAQVFTFSVHQEHNYPAVKPPSDLDVGLEDGTGDGAYLEVLREHLPRICEEHRPDLAFYLAGADPYREDQLGGLSLTKEGLRRRDAYVLETLREAGVAVAVVLAGGYARRLEDTVALHCATVEEAERIFQG